MGRSVRRSVGAVAALALLVGWLVVSALPAAALAHGISISKECVPFTAVGQPYQCRITIANNPLVETALDTLVVDGVTDTVTTKGGPVSSNTVFPGGLLPQFSLTLLGGATCNGGQTQCTLPSGAAIASTFFSWYTPVAADFGLANHTLVDAYTVAWHDTCSQGAVGCNPGAQSNSAGAATTLVDANIQINPPTDTNRVGDTHVFTGHVNVSCQPDGGSCVNGFQPAPDGTQISFTIDSGPGGFTTANPCTSAGGSGECQISLVSALTGVTVVSAHTTVTVSGLVLHRDTNGTGLNSGPASKTWVNAKISIVASATNEVAHSHTFTATLQKDLGDGNGFVGASGEHVDVTLADSNGAVHSAPTGTCTGAGANTNAAGQCEITFTSNSTGQVTGHATSTLSVGGVSISVATNGVAPNSGDVVKTFVDANIQISPANATNAVNTNHTLVGHVNVDAGDGNGLVNAPDGTTINFSIVSGPGGFVGPNTCLTSGGTGLCTVVISSPSVGTTVVNASTTPSVGGVSLTRATGDTHVGDSPNANKNWADDTVRTDIHDPAHTVITSAAAGTVVHDKVFVTRTAGTPAGVPNPTGNVTFRRYTTIDCSGSATDQTVPLVGGTAESSPFTVSADMSYTASYQGDANYPARDGVCEPLSVTTQTGKHLSYSGSMEGALKWSPGAFVNGGYHFKLSEKNAVPVTVQVTGVINVPVHCGSPHGPLAAGSPIAVPVSIAPFTIPANSTAWYLSGDQNNILTWMGSVASPDLCGGQLMYNSEGATVDVFINASAHTGAIMFQWHYRIPAAKGKPNTDCTNDADPNRDRADVCGASWSATKDP